MKGFVHPTARVHDSVTFEGDGEIAISEFAVVEPHVMLDSSASPTGCIAIGRRAKLKQGAIIRTYGGSIAIEDRVSIGEYTVLAGHGGITVGATTIVSGHCYLGASGHIFSSEVPIRFQGESAAGIHIEENVWIGAHVVVQDGVCIAQGAVIGSGAVVTRSMPASSICFGAPCRPVRSRPAGSPARQRH